MGEIIKQTTSGTYTPTVTSAQGNTVTAGQFWYIRNNNVVQIGGRISAGRDILPDDEISFNVPFVNLFADIDQATGIYSVQRPHTAYISPITLDYVQFFSQTNTNTVILQYVSSSPPNSVIIFNINVFYTIQ